jgi:hypothetical protein
MVESDNSIGVQSRKRAAVQAGTVYPLPHRRKPQAYGLDEITEFNICCESIGGGSYAIYFVFA